MPLEIDPKILEVSLKILKWLGVTSVASFLSLYAAWLTFPPHLVIEGVIDKSKTFNSESKMKIKNNGLLPAISVKADAENVCAQIGGITLKDCGFYGGPNVIGKLTHNESAEITIRPGICMDNGMRMSSFSYVLILKYKAKLFFLEKDMQKRWQVNLRNFEDGYSWDIKIL